MAYAYPNKPGVPFTARRWHELSGGRSAEVNRQLIADNAALAAETAVAYAQLKNA